MRSVLKMWRVKKLNLSLSPSPQPVSERASWRDSWAGTSRRGAGRPAVSESWVERERGESFVGPAASAHLGSALLFLLPHELKKGGWKGRLAGPRLSHTLSFSGKTSHENSSPRTYRSSQCPHQLWKRVPDVPLAGLIAVQARAAGEIRLASFSTGSLRRLRAQRNRGPGLGRN